MRTHVLSMLLRVAFQGRTCCPDNYMRLPQRESENYMDPEEDFPCCLVSMRLPFPGIQVACEAVPKPMSP